METNDASRDLSAGILVHSRAKTEVLEVLLNYSEYVQRLTYSTNGSAIDDVLSNLDYLNEWLKKVTLPLCAKTPLNLIAQSNKDEDHDGLPWRTQ